ncbi:serpin family protein [Methanoregula sp.]|uniref:serpin family protein n=1 Tax=Methanoregula sp. TaxID=2052170 RepID=UPI002BCD87FE|nr:serpin family protein [Methanoregula sp.]HVP95708.1 serpin family protein [Methanoregula sp.]
MKHRTLCLIALASAFVVLIVLAAGCTGTSPAQAGERTPSPTVTAAPSGAGSAGTADNSVTDANNRFSASLYRQLAAGDTTGNIFFSPFSISSALAITYEGARGTTADEIRSVFSFPANQTAMREGYAAENAAINAGNEGYTLSTANALWAEKTFAFLPEYTATAEQYYGANTSNLDFVNQPDASRQTINTWVAEKTNNKIQDLLPAGSVSSMTRLVITNAVYFKGTWEKQFDANQTTDAPFSIPGGSQVTVKMMQQTGKDAVYPYAETADLQMLSLPYTAQNGQGLSMVILLPKDNNTTVAVPYLDPANLSALEQSAVPQQVKVYIPKFKVETQYSLPATLSAMGMPTAFTNNADFSGMDGAKDLYISDIVHKAYIETNEEGTEAAAATGVVVNVMAVAPGYEQPVPVFRADHPFLFLIQDNNTGTVLFTGRITNPSST